MERSDAVGDRPGYSAPLSSANTCSPPWLGTQIVKGIPLTEIVPHLDTRTLFRLGWGLTGPDAADLERDVGEPRLAYWIDRLKSEPAISPAVVYGYFPARTCGDTVTLRAIEADDEPVSFVFPRQKRDPFSCLADWVGDVLPMQLVTVGEVASDFAAALYAADKYRDYFEFNALAAALTEALAGYWHGRIRAELGLPDDLGERFSFGYPACPDLSERRKIVDLLRPERIGVQLSDEFQLAPEFATDALIITDPAARYFSV